MGLGALLLVLAAASALDIAELKARVKTDDCAGLEKTLRAQGDAFPALVAALFVEPAYSRCTSIALARLKDPRSLPVLQKFLENEATSRDRKFQAANLIRSTDPKFYTEVSAPYLFKLLTRVEDTTSAYQLIQLAESYPPAIPALKTLLSSKDQSLVEIALLGVRALKDRSGLIPELAKLLDNPKHRDNVEELLESTGAEEAAQAVDEYFLRQTPKAIRNMLVIATSKPVPKTETISTYFPANWQETRKSLVVTTTNDDLKQLVKATAVTTKGNFLITLSFVKKDCEGFCGEEKSCEPVAVFKLRKLELETGTAVIVFPGHRPDLKWSAVKLKAKVTASEGCELWTSGKIAKRECNKAAADSGRTTTLTYGDIELLSTFQDYGSGGTGNFIAMLKSGKRAYLLYQGLKKLTSVHGIATIDGNHAEPSNTEARIGLICDG